ncbi:MAG TPA: ATP-binding protein [Planctomycetota bacterium]|nr:ATP-binding protein [Planctomycetota bacterium]
MPSATEILYFAASAGNLFLANLVAFRARRARGALPISLLCVALFVWDFGQGMFYPLRRDFPESRWYIIRLIGSATVPAFLWHFVLVFTGRDRSLRPWLYAMYVVSGLFALSTAAGLGSPAVSAFIHSERWNLIYLGIFMPMLAVGFRLVQLRKREAQTPVERNAANFVAFGLAVAVVMSFTELAHAMMEGLPPLGHIGSVLCIVIMAVAILRHRLLEKETPVRTVFFLLLLAGSAAVVIALLSSRVPENLRTAFVFGAVALTTLISLWRTLFIHLYEQAERRQRLALIGTMAAGVAHEIRNPLASIKGAAQFVQKDLEGTPGKEEAKDYLKLLVGEVDRLNGVVESYLTYARPVEPRLQDLPLETFLKDLLRLQAASLPPAIRVVTSFDADLPPARFDPGLLTQAITNALRNAVDVMPEGGTLAVRTSGVVSALRSWAAIEIEDTGCGIARADLDRIFHPFYTTKTKGTGLGLAISMRILEAHGGDIAVENVEPRGCRFTFFLPLPVL